MERNSRTTYFSKEIQREKDWELVKAATLSDVDTSLNRENFATYVPSTGHNILWFKNLFVSFGGQIILSFFVKTKF
jgi:hypothetical protein